MKPQEATKSVLSEMVDSRLENAPKGSGLEIDLKKLKTNVNNGNFDMKAFEKVGINEAELNDKNIFTNEKKFKNPETGKFETSNSVDAKTSGEFIKSDKIADIDTQIVTQSREETDSNTAILKNIQIYFKIVTLR